MSNNSDWKRKLKQVLDKHNWRQDDKANIATYKAAGARAQVMFEAFKQLRNLGFQPAPKSLGGNHVQKLVWYWTADRRIEALCNAHGVAMPEEPISLETLQARLHVLRTFCSWIGKPGMVLSPANYVADPTFGKSTRDGE